LHLCKNGISWKSEHNRRGEIDHASENSRSAAQPEATGGEPIRELNNEVHTFCLFGSGATTPWDMPDAVAYLNGRSGATLQCTWNSFGICEHRLRNAAIASIVNRHTPVVIGTGWLSHYPLAFGYATQQRTVRHCFIWCWTDEVTDRCFYVNEGWGGGGAGDWIEASTWFAGQISP
jgi:hypothetical protein